MSRFPDKDPLVPGGKIATVKTPSGKEVVSAAGKLGLLENAPAAIDAEGILPNRTITIGTEVIPAIQEQYLLDLDTADAGSYKLGNSSPDGFTTPLAFDADDATIEAALLIVYGTGITVNSLVIRADAVLGLTFVDIDLTNPGTAGVTESEVLQSPDVPRTVVVNADAAALAALAAVLVSGTDLTDESISENFVVVSGDVNGAKAFKSVTSVTIIATESYTLSLDTASAGSYKLGNDVDGFTAPLAFNADDATIEIALAGVAGYAGIEPTVSSLVITGSGSGPIYAMTFVDIDLTNPGTAGLTISTAGEIEVGLDALIGLPLITDISRISRVGFNNDVIASSVWTQALDAAELALNTLDAGAASTAAFDGTKVLSVDFTLPA